MQRVTAVLVGTGAAVGVLGSSAVAASAAPMARASAASVDTVVRAVRTAAGAGNGVPYSIERDRFRGRSVWEVEVARASGRSPELLVSADGRTVVRRSTTRRTVDASRARAARVSLASALRTAARRASGTFDEADIDRHRGRSVWSVTFKRGRTETEVAVDASTGAVVRVERDD